MLGWGGGEGGGRRGGSALRTDPIETVVDMVLTYGENVVQRIVHSFFIESSSNLKVWTKIKSLMS